MILNLSFKDINYREYITKNINYIKVFIRDERIMSLCTVLKRDN